jgi:tetratricopeptide (TPR) repeat protein
MKRYFLVILLGFGFLLAVAQSNDKSLWKDDLRYLQATIHTKYSNLFYNVSSQQFDSAVSKMIVELPGMDEAEFQSGIGKIMAMFHIGHTQAGYLFQNMNREHSGHNSGGLFPFIPIEFYMFSDGFYVKSASNTYKELVGAKIIEIGQFPTAKALEKLRPYVNYENEYGFISNVPFYLRFPKLLFIAGISTSKDKLRIKYEKLNQIKETFLDTDDNSTMVFKTTGLERIPEWTDASDLSENPVPIWKQDGAKYRNLVYVPESKICYIRHSVTLNDKEQTIKDFFNKAYDFVEKNDVAKLVLDVRTNGGGNNQLIKPIITGIIQLKKINQKGKFFCIIGRRTFSACQNLVNELERYTEVIFVGEPTSENVNFYGDTRAETLPNSKVQVFCSWLWWQNSDPRDFRKFTAPQLAVDMSFKDYASNLDPVMNTIEQYKPATSFIDSLKQLELADRHEEAMQFARHYFTEPVNKYYISKLESEINALGYSLLYDRKTDAAKNTFELNTMLFPYSGNTYDSFAECCMKIGLKEEGLKHYRKALEIEPNYANAEEARKIIGQNK